MAGLNRKKLSKAFNRNVGGIVGGLLDLKNEPGSKLDFDIVAGKEPLTTDRVFIKTNIPIEGPAVKLAILIDPIVGIRPYDYFMKSNGEMALGASSSFRRFDERDVGGVTVEAALEAIAKKAELKGLLPNHKFNSPKAA